MSMETLRLAPRATVSEIVASNVRAEVARAGITQRNFARLIGLSQSNVSHRWNGERAWKLDELGFIADALGVSVADLVTPTGRERCPRQDSNLQPSDS